MRLHDTASATPPASLLAIPLELPAGEGTLYLLPHVDQVRLWCPRRPGEHDDDGSRERALRVRRAMTRIGLDPSAAYPGRQLRGHGVAASLAPAWTRPIDLVARAGRAVERLSVIDPRVRRRFGLKDRSPFFAGAPPHDLEHLVRTVEEVGTTWNERDREAVCDVAVTGVELACDFMLQHRSTGAWVPGDVLKRAMHLSIFRPWRSVGDDLVHLRTWNRTTQHGAWSVRQQRRTGHAAHYLRAPGSVNFKVYADQPSKLWPDGPNALHIEAVRPAGSVPAELRQLRGVLSLVQPYVALKWFRRYVAVRFLEA